MMILRSASASPFARKVRMAASILGVDREITIEAADTAKPDTSLLAQNPLGKIPILVTEDGATLFDSRVILEYLDMFAGGGCMIPKDNGARFAALRRAALADGIMDASILLIYEARWRAPEKHEPKWIAHQADKVARGLAELERNPPGIDVPPNVGQIGVACALGYLDFRFAGRWRADHPVLVAWIDRFSTQVPAFDATKPG